MMKTLQAAATVLVEARKLIEKGWCQGSDQLVMVELPDAFCPIGAINFIEGYSSRKSAVPRAHTIVSARLSEAPVPQAISIWNDKPGRTKPEVLAAFDKAIEIAKEFNND